MNIKDFSELEFRSARELARDFVAKFILGSGGTSSVKVPK